MAVVTQVVPQLYTPLYNDMLLTLYGFDATKYKNKYVINVSVYVLTPTPTLLPYPVGTFKSELTYSEPGANAAGVFNLKDVLQYVPFFTSYQRQKYDKQCLKVDVEYGEEYATTPSGAVSFVSSGTFTYYVFNGALSLTEFRQYDHTKLINTTTVAASGGIGIKTLTSIPSRKILKSSKVAVDYLIIAGNNIKTRVTYYNGSTLISTQDVSTPSDFLYQTSAQVSPYELTIPTNTTRYTVQLLRTSNNNPLSDIVEYIIDEGCSQYEKVNVYYQNKYGAEDVFVFDKKSTKNTDIQREVYKTSYGLTNDYTRAGVNVYNSKVTTKHVLNTDWLSKDDYIALGELVESNNVFIQFDGTAVLGVKAEVTLTFIQIGPSWDFMQNQVLNATLGGATSLTAAFPITAGGYSFADDFYGAEIKPILLASNWATYFDFDESGIDSTNLVLRLVAKQNGTAYSLTAITAGAPGIDDQIESSNVIAGVDEFIPIRIPVKVENTTFDYKKEANLELYQIELTVTERLTYERQMQ